jgi:ribose transport system ATP-binding protein/rhamnose transport system ATP-binding protein
MPAVLKAENITMHYAETAVLKGVDFSAAKGEMHAIIGRNASGKTTLGLILSGALSPTSGQVLFEGNTLPKDRNEVEKMGIFMVEQSPVLFPDLEVYASIVYGHERLLFGNHFFMPSRAKMIELSQNIIHKVGLNLNPCAKTGNLSEGELQLINLARVLVCNPRVLILDEFSASLTPYETKIIFKILKHLRDEGKCIILISHSLNDILQNCDRVSVFDKSGGLTVYTIEEARKLPIAELMFGEKKALKYPYLPIKRGKLILSIKNINAGILKDISFKLHQGDLLGIAGLVGSGRTTLVKTILDKLRDTHDNTGLFDTYTSIYQSRLGMVPENSDEAMFQFSSIGENAIISNLQKALKGPFLSNTSENIYARDVVDRFGIIPRNIFAYPHMLSSGNKQKVVIARLLFSNSKVILFDEPTKNIDAAGKVDFYNILNQMRQNGVAVVLISSDFSELIGMCNRILVLRNGKKFCEMDTYNITLDELYTLTTNNQEDLLE